jgi:hypothetical protein
MPVACYQSGDIEKPENTDYGNRHYADRHVSFRRYFKRETIFLGAYVDTFHASNAFGMPHRFSLSDSYGSRACMLAFFTVDALRRPSFDLHGTEYRQQPQERSVGAQITAPEISYDYRN